ncbi:MAG: HIT family protein [Bdellovibrionales bacterium]|nr:HIT family protein [Oligoflexia bacterium]
MSSPFSSLLLGEDLSLVIAESAYFIAALEKWPIVAGHVLIISKQTEDDLFDLDDASLASMLLFAKPIAKAMKKLFPCKKVGIAVLGLETRHAHVHLVPLNSPEDLNFTRAKLTPDPKALITFAEELKALCLIKHSAL